MGSNFSVVVVMAKAPAIFLRTDERSLVERVRSVIDALAQHERAFSDPKQVREALRVLARRLGAGGVGSTRWEAPS